MTARPVFLTRNPATRKEIEGVPTPKGTDTYMPVPYSDVLGILEQEVTASGYKIDSESYGISRDGDQMFGVWSLDMGSDLGALAVGFRSSHDKTLPIGFVSGLSVLVCDNLCFSGDDDQIVRKHTKNVYEDLASKIATVIANSRPSFARMNSQMESMHNVQMDDTAFYRWLGDCLRTGAVNRQILGKAASLWNKPPHKEFKRRTLFAGYNAVNEALKISQARDITPRHFKLHQAALAWGQEAAA